MGRGLLVLVLFADQNRNASGGKIEGRNRRLGPRQRGDFPLDEAGIDLAARHQRMRQQRFEEREIVITPAISNPPSASTIRSSACGRSAPHAISFASSAS